jgi:diguanylate cyclase
VSLVDPSADLVMITTGLVVISGLPASLRRTLGTVIAGLITIAITDCVLVYLQIHGLTSSIAVVIGWAIGLLLIGVGALTGIGQPKRPLLDLQTSRRIYWLPYVPMPFAIVLGVAELWSTTDRPVRPRCSSTTVT